MSYQKGLYVIYGTKAKFNILISVFKQVLKEKIKIIPMKSMDLMIVNQSYRNQAVRMIRKVKLHLVI